MYVIFPIESFTSSYIVKLETSDLSILKSVRLN